VNGENRVRSASVVFVASKLRKLRGWFFVLVVRMVVVMAVVMMANVCTNGKSAAKGGDLLRANENKKIKVIFLCFCLIHPTLSCRSKSLAPLCAVQIFCQK
jgi:hypothetical protein